MIFKRWPCVMQNNQNDCANAAIATILLHYKQEVPLSIIEAETRTLIDGTTMLGMVKALEKLCFDSKVVRCKLSELSEDVTMPCIVQVLGVQGRYHFVVIHQIKKGIVVYADPASGIKKETMSEFERKFTGVVLFTIMKSTFETTKFKKIGIIEILQTLILPHKKLLIQIISLSFILTFLGVISSLFSKVLMDEIIPYSLKHTLVIFVIFFSILTIIQNGLSTCRQHVLLFLSRKIDIPLLLGYYNHILHLPYTFFTHRKIGDIITRFQDAMTIKEIFTNLSVSLVMDVTLALITCILLWLLNSSLFFILLGIVGMNIGLIYIFKKPYKEINMKQMQAISQLNSGLIESLKNIETIKAIVNEQQQMEKLENHLIESQKIGYKEAVLKNLQGFISSILNGIGNLLFMAIGALYIMDHKMSIGDLMVFQTLSQFFIEPVQSLVSLQLSFQEANIAMQRLNELMMIEKESNAGSTLSQIDDITFHNITFSYGYKKPIFKDLNITIQKNKAIGIVGESGVGKSSFAKLLLRFLEVQQGSITIGEQNITMLNAYELRKQIAYVPQKPQLFCGSIVDNLRVNDYTISMERIVQVCKQLCIHEFIEGLDEKYFSKVEEDGSNFSLGEQQRLTIARAILQNANYYIFDEATSNLDAISEVVIQQLIFKQLRDTTRIVIAHKLSTVEQCDEIYVLKNGTFVEHGSHKALIKRKGVYFEMAKLQNRVEKQ